jgi:two-component system KDP operon response regulator KdpE
MRKVLLMEEKPMDGRILKSSLERNDYEVHVVASGPDTLRSIRTLRPDIVLLEIAPQYREAPEILKSIRVVSSIPVVVLSAGRIAGEVAALLDAGADDYVPIPFVLEVLLARMKGVLRRTLPSPDEPEITCGDLVVNLAERSVYLGERRIGLTATEYSILAYLARNRGRVVAQAKLLEELWGPQGADKQGSLRVHVLSLRRKIEKDPSHPEIIHTDARVGYIFGPSRFA